MPAVFPPPGVTATALFAMPAAELASDCIAKLFSTNELPFTIGAEALVEIPVLFAEKTLFWIIGVAPLWMLMPVPLLAIVLDVIVGLALEPLMLMLAKEPDVLENVQPVIDGEEFWIWVP
jgi:hypothetical protein